MWGALCQSWSLEIQFYEGGLLTGSDSSLLLEPADFPDLVTPIVGQCWRGAPRWLVPHKAEQVQRQLPSCLGSRAKHRR